MQCLDMSARTFFSVLREGRGLKNREFYFTLHELTYVSLCANVTEHKWIEDLRQSYKNIFQEVPYKKNPHAFDMEDPAQRRYAASVLTSFFAQKKRLEGLDG